MSVGKLKSTAAPTDALETIPGVGPSIARDLRELGYTCVSDLRGENPARMYYSLCETRGAHIDRCVLYVFRCAVYYASHEVYDPDLLKWWNWKDDAVRHAPAPAPAPRCTPVDGTHECCE
ncbi:MAG TPA: pathogenicity locus [Chromatiales bacterium]|nr:pathogenicity locus [Chromatiales bacterium]